MRDALLLGATAAVGWACLAITLAQSARIAGAWAPTFWTGLMTIVLTSALAAASSGPPGGELKDWAFVALAGIAYLGSMFTFLLAIRGGEVSLVTPIIGCDGAFAALLAVAAGEVLGVGPAVGLAAMILALVLVTSADGDARRALPDDRSTRRTVAIALISACFFGMVFFLTGKASGIDPLWVVAGARLPSTVIAFFVCLRTGELTPPRAARPWLLPSGAIDAVAFTCYVEAARSSISIAAVTASQYATIAAITGAVLFRERLRPRQWIGIAILAGAAALIGATS